MERQFENPLVPGVVDYHSVPGRCNTRRRVHMPRVVAGYVRFAELTQELSRHSVQPYDTVSLAVGDEQVRALSR